MISDNELWQNALVHIELATSQASFRTWFRNITIVGRDEGTIHLAVPSKIVKEWLMEKHHKMILSILRNLDNSIRAVDYSVHKVLAHGDIRKKAQTPVGNTAMDLNKLYIDKRDNLNPRYTFDTFVVGSFNQLAYTAAKAILENPGALYNPLFIYGPTGYGKTHLTQAIGNYFKKNHTNKKVIYITSEKFAVDYINSVKNGTANNFKNQYRQYDVLIMDDIQFIASTEKTQEELFHLFNALRDNNKQIIFSSDKHPMLMPGFEDRLKSRFVGGMIAEITEPDIESRKSIIQAKIDAHGFSIPAEVVTFIAESVRGNIREIEGVLNMVECRTQVKGKPITVLDIKPLVKNTLKQQKGISIEEVVRRVAQYYSISEQGIYEKSRKKEVVRPRQVIMYILREEFNISFPTIGEKLGGRDHTTVIHSCEKIKKEIEVNSVTEQEVEHIRSLVHA